MPTFAEQLTQYMKRVGVTDAELARKIGVQRQTIFRWKEGTVGRPRVREDVLRCADSLRLTPEERDQFLLAAGFAPEHPGFAASAIVPAPDVPVPNVQPLDEPSADAPSTVSITAGVESIISEPSSAPLPLAESAESERTAPFVSLTQAPSIPLPPLPQRRILPSWWPLLGLITVLFILLVGGMWLYRRLAQPQLGSVINVVTTPARSISGAVGGVTSGATISPSLLLPKTPGGIVVSQFSTVLDSARYDVAKRIKEAIDAEISDTELATTTVLIWPQNILSKESAQETLQAAGAALVIWGEYDSGRVVVQFTMHNKLSDQREIPVENPNELSSTINVKLKEAVKLLALLTLGKAYLNDGLYTKANLAFNRALDLKPEARDTQTTLYFNLGYAAQNSAYQNHARQTYDQAIGYYSNAIDLNPAMFEALYNRGAAYLEKSYLIAANSAEITQSLDAAIDNLNQVIQIQPAYTNAYINRGISYYERHQATDLQAAIHDFDRVIELTPSDYKGYYNRGLARIRAGDLAGWTADLTQTVAITPTYSPAFDGLCWGYALAQDPKRALPFCAQSIVLEEKFSTSKAGHVSRGIVHAELGRYTEAVADFEIYRTWLKSLQPTSLYERMNGRKVEQWIVTLQQHKNPFDRVVLNSLR